MDVSDMHMQSYTFCVVLLMCLCMCENRMVEGLVMCVCRRQ